MLPLSVGQQRHQCHAHTLTTFIFQDWIWLSMCFVRRMLNTHLMLPLAKGAIVVDFAG